MKYLFSFLLLTACIWRLNAQPDPAKAVLDKLNELAATYSLKVKSTTHAYSFALKGDTLLLNDDLYMSGYDKKMESYFTQRIFSLRDLTAVTKDQKIAACWIVFELRDKKLSYCISKGEVDKDCHDMQMIWEKKAGKTDAPEQVRELIKELMKIKGITAPF